MADRISIIFSYQGLSEYFGFRQINFFLTVFICTLSYRFSNVSVSYSLAVLLFNSIFPIILMLTLTNRSSLFTISLTLNYVSEFRSSRSTSAFRHSANLCFNNIFALILIFIVSFLTVRSDILLTLHASIVRIVL